MGRRGSVVVHGDVSGSVIITGNRNTVRVGKKRRLPIGDGSVVVHGNVKDSVIVTGFGNKVK